MMKIGRMKEILLRLAEKTTPEVINFMVTHGRGLVCAPITKNVRESLDLAPMVDHNTDPHGTAFTVSIDYININNRDFCT